MRITAVGAEYFLRLSTGNYGSEEFRVGLQAQLEEGDDYAAVLAKLKNIAQWEVRERLLKSSFSAVRDAASRIQPDDLAETPFGG